MWPALLTLAMAPAFAPAPSALTGRCRWACRAAPPRNVGGGDLFCEENVRAALVSFQHEAESMFGCNARAASIGITGAIDLVELDGPNVVLTLSGRFWHKRVTVLMNAAAYLRRDFPEIASVDIYDEDDLIDVVRSDDEDGAVIEDRRSPDYNGDRAAMEYQGIDPDMRGPFPQGVGGLRPGGSLFS